MPAAAMSTGRAVAVMAVVVGCLAVLWPRIFYPMLLVALKGSEPEQEQLPPLRPPRGPMAQRMQHSGKAFPPPHPRTVTPPKGQRSSFNIIMPIYTLGVIVLFVYMIFKIMSRRDQNQVDLDRHAYTERGQLGQYGRQRRTAAAAAAAQQNANNNFNPPKRNRRDPRGALENNTKRILEHYGKDKMVEALNVVVGEMERYRSQALELERQLLAKYKDEMAKRGDLPPDEQLHETKTEAEGQGSSSSEDTEDKDEQQQQNGVDEDEDVEDDQDVEAEDSRSGSGSGDDVAEGNQKSSEAEDEEDQQEDAGQGQDGDGSPAESDDSNVEAERHSPAVVPEEASCPVEEHKDSIDSGIQTFGNDSSFDKLETDSTGEAEEDDRVEGNHDEAAEARRAASTIDELCRGSDDGLQFLDHCSEIKPGEKLNCYDDLIYGESVSSGQRSPPAQVEPPAPSSTTTNWSDSPSPLDDAETMRVLQELISDQRSGQPAPSRTAAATSDEPSLLGNTVSDYQQWTSISPQELFNAGPTSAPWPRDQQRNFDNGRKVRRRRGRALLADRDPPPNHHRRHNNSWRDS